MKKNQAGEVISPDLRFIKKKKKIIVSCFLGIIILLVGTFFLGRISVKDKSPRLSNVKDKNKNQQRVNYLFLIDNYYAFNNVFSDISRGDWNMFYISKNHPRIKELLREGKLQEGKKKQFIIRYEKVDKRKEGGESIFNEFNQELEIFEA